jgi:uncharacterized protein (DUF1697 family)
MSKYVAFLRGINVGGTKVIKMEVLRRLFESLGFANVSTYIQTGNVIFDARAKNLTTLQSKVQEELKNSLGHEISVALMNFSDLNAIVKQDPFASVEVNEDVMLFVTFLSAQPAAIPKLPLAVPKENFEVIGIQDRAVFIVARRKSDGRAAFPNAFIEKQFGVPGTTRNWAVVKKIAKSTND